MKKGTIKATSENKSAVTLIFTDPSGNKIPIVSINKEETAALQRDLTRLWKEMS